MQIETELKSFFQTVFLCLNMFFLLSHAAMVDLQCVQSLEIISYIQFARVNINLYDHVVHRIMLQAAQEPNNVQHIIDLLPPQALSKWQRIA